MVNPTVVDKSLSKGHAELIPPEDQETFIKARKENDESLGAEKTYQYSIGKYDENRVNLYSSALFQNDENMVDGFDGARTLHMGIDLCGPVGSAVYSFADGVVHGVGYNSELGDYGYVVVVEYDFGKTGAGSSTNCSSDPDTNVDESTDATSDDACDSATDSAKIWALYGHLDASTLERNAVGKEVKKGAILGLLGDVDENGGW